VEVTLTLALCFSRNHVLLKVLRLVLLATVIVDVGHHGTLEVIVQLSPAFVRGRSLVVLPCRVIVGFVLPFYLWCPCQYFILYGTGGVRLPGTRSPSSEHRKGQTLHAISEEMVLGPYLVPVPSLGRWSRILSMMGPVSSSAVAQ
jgi:hypothetical protein